MNKSTLDALSISVNILFFVATLSYVVWTYLELPSSFDALQGPETVYMEEIKIPEEVLWTGSQVVAKLYRINDNEVPITVNGRVFNNDADVMKNQKKVDLKSTYSMKIGYDHDGEISEIVFKKIS
ncbi:hypothetical protein [Viridibacillus arvi]|uniref:hypothetical protein n=1 Tax=Viridibacillus arvi TaxID=263475 RepID=UPI003D267D81